MKNIKNILKKLNLVQDNQTDFNPDFRNKRREWLCKLANRYLDYDAYQAFSQALRSQRVAENRKAYPIADFLIKKYRREQESWQEKKQQIRQRIKTKRG